MTTPEYSDQALSLRKNTGFITALLVLFLLVWWLPTPQGFKGMTHYLPLHMAMETLAIIVTMQVFSIAWYSHQQERSGKLILLGCMLLMVGLIDFAHMLSYSGMPDFITPGGVEKAINFWLIARLLAALALLFMATLPPFKIAFPYTPCCMLATALLATGLVYWLGLYHADHLPATFSLSQGLTAFKIGAEWLIVSLLAIPALLFYRQAKRTENHTAANLFAAATISILSELNFMLYKEVSDIFNLLGHVYKVTAYLFIYKAVFVETVQAPYQRLEQTQATLLHEQETLQQQSAMLNLFYTLPFIGMGMLSPHTKTWLSANRYLCEMLGYSHTDLLQKSWVALIHPEDSNTAQDYLEQLLNGALEDYILATRFLHASGKTIFTTCTVRCVRQLDGTPKDIVITLQDVSARHQLEEAQRQTLQQLETLANASPALLWTAGTNKGYNWFNQRWLDFTGRRMEQEQGNGWTEGIHKDDVSACVAEYVNAFETRQPFSIEYRLRRQDGEYRWLLDQGMPRYDANGDFIGYIGSCLDITERKQTEAALQESESRFRVLFEQAAVGVAQIETSTGRFLHLNRKYCQITGYSEMEMRQLDFMTITHPDDIEKDLANMKRLRANELRSYEIEKRYIHKDNHIVWVKLTVSSMWTPEEKSDCHIAVIQDITESKQAEEKIRQLNIELEQRVIARTLDLEAVNTELESFAYAVSHDLRAPLRAMSGFSQALLEDYADKLDAEAGVFLNEITLASYKMGALIDGLLKLSRFARGALQHETVHLSSLAERILAMLAAEEPQRNVQWQVVPELKAWGDKLMLEVLLHNLLSNAWKYTQKTEQPLIRLYQETQGDQTLFCVADNGAGFDMAYSERLFKPFQRLHRQDEFPGIGIGLATVQRIVHRHGGTLNATSNPGQGAIFQFGLPRPQGLDSLN